MDIFITTWQAFCLYGQSTMGTQNQMYQLQTGTVTVVLRFKKSPEECRFPDREEEEEHSG